MTPFRQAVLATLVVANAVTYPVFGQSLGSVEGQVTLDGGGGPVHGAVVLVVGPGLVALTDTGGSFVIENVPVGDYELLAQREHLTAERQTITVDAGQRTVVDFVLRLSPVHEEVTVTATPGSRATAFEAFNAITTVDSFDIVANPVGTLAAAIEDEPGIGKRGFGPGAGRPIIRGFDGDRVMIMEDGVGTGDLSGQSGDHGVTTDPNGLERIEVVRGPATLLYGSNAVGGVVNAITPHESFRDTHVAGTRGQFNFDGGSANEQAGTSASVQHGRGHLTIWASGGARRTDDYSTPEGVVANSATQLSHVRAGLGYVGERLYTSGSVTLENGRNGIPLAGELHGHEEETASALPQEDDLAIGVDSRRRVGRFDLGMRNLTNGLADAFRVVFTSIDWEHDEVETLGQVQSIGTTFDNRTYVVRAEVDQRPRGALSGTFGVWAKHRNYTAEGEEVLAPPTEQVAFAAFGYEELDFGRYRIQLGGRIERNAYTVSERQGVEAPFDLQPSLARDRAFTGLSASAGVQADMGANETLVANVTRSYRAPALEELYNFGPHVGNLLFEIGNPDLDRESILGLDFSLRHQSQRMRGQFNFYSYDIDKFVFLDVGDEVIEGLQVAEYVQGDSRFIGFDAKGSLRLGAQVWASLGLGLVDAQLTSTNEPLPRIPPIKGSASVDLPYRGFTITPELILAAKQTRTFRDETESDGYSVVNVRASHVWPKQHLVHVLSVSAFNLTNELYRNHSSFIKDLAPEIGRGVRVGYSLRFF